MLSHRSLSGTERLSRNLGLPCSFTRRVEALRGRIKRPDELDKALAELRSALKL